MSAFEFARPTTCRRRRSVYSRSDIKLASMAGLCRYLLRRGWVEAKAREPRVRCFSHEGGYVVTVPDDPVIALQASHRRSFALKLVADVEGVAVARIVEATQGA